jgi:hypothetical protein
MMHMEQTTATMEKGRVPMALAAIDTHAMPPWRSPDLCTPSGMRVAHHST